MLRLSSMLAGAAFAGAATVALAAMSVTSFAQEVTLKLHQMLPPQATIPAKAVIGVVPAVVVGGVGAVAVAGLSALLFPQLRKVRTLSGRE